MKNRLFHCVTIIFMLGGVLLASGPACGETVSFPLQVDYPFLTSLVVQSAFTEPDRTMVVTDPDNACQRISLSTPILASENSLLRMEVAVHLRGGTIMGGSCLFPIEWDGYLVAHMKPRISPGDWRLSFDPVDTLLLDKNRRPDRLMGQLWRFFEAPVMSRLANMQIAINEPIEELKPFLLAVVSEAEIPRMNALLSSLRPGSVAADPEVLRIEVVADIETRPAGIEAPPPAPLTADEMDAFIEIWETWDAFLVQALMSMTNMPLTPEERETLLLVLLDARYRFVNELEANAPASSGDFVREQFVSAWEKLSPIIRHHLSGHLRGQPAADSWGYLAFITASDALAALDKLGPVLNIEISKNGFIRLARMLSENKEMILRYSPEIDPDLRTLLGLAPAPEITEPDVDETILEQEAVEPEPAPEMPPTSMTPLRSVLSDIFRLVTPRECRAEKSGASPSLAELSQWLVTRDKVDAHLKKIKPLLEAATRENLRKNSIPESHHKMFQKAVYATAWQESCFRQFVVDKNKLTYLLSYNNSSVGMMQINERVWRGIYNLQHLRWDINYNAAAGIDILNLYLQKYALPQKSSLSGKAALDTDGLAGALYAMYNGGPGAFSTYVKRRSTRQFSKIDAHFREKYAWVENGRWERLKDCF